MQTNGTISLYGGGGEMVGWCIGAKVLLVIGRDLLTLLPGRVHHRHLSEGGNSLATV